MRTLGDVCDTLANAVAELLRRGQVHVFDPGQFSGGGAAPLGTAGGSYILLSRELITTFSDADHRSANVDSHGTPRPETLQLILAHEADHLLGRDHIDSDGYLTANSLGCSDLR